MECCPTRFEVSVSIPWYAKIKSVNYSVQLWCLQTSIIFWNNEMEGGLRLSESMATINTLIEY